VTPRPRNTSSSLSLAQRKGTAKPRSTGAGPARKLPDVTEPPYAGIGRLLRTAHSSFTRLFTLNLAKLDITFGQFQHLQYLWVSDGITQVELAALIGVQPAASTAILLALEQTGYIRRVRNDADRRKINVFLTPKGRAAKQPLLQCAKDANEIASRTLSEQTLAELRQTIGVMVNNLTAALPNASGEVEDDEEFSYRRKGV